MNNPIKIAFDASTIIAMDNPRVQMIEFTLRYFSNTGHVLVMCTENLVECFSQKSGLRSSGVLREIQGVDGGIFSDVKDSSKKLGIRLNDDNDYKGIATAIQERCKYFVSNDYRQVLAAQKYAESKGVELTALKPPLFLMYMHLANKELFPWNKNIEFTVSLFHHEELPNIFDGVRNRDWNKEDTLDRFTPYGMNINTTVQAELATQTANKR